MDGDDTLEVRRSCQGNKKNGLKIDKIRSKRIKEEMILELKSKICRQNICIFSIKCIKKVTRIILNNEVQPVTNN